MNLRVFCLSISFMLFFHQCILKSLPEEGEIDSEPEESEFSDEIEAVHGTKHHNLKHARQNHPRGLNRRRRAYDDIYVKKPCAVMYKNGEPVGILQPYQDSFQLLPVHNDETISVDIQPLAKEDADDISKRDASDEAAKRDEENVPYTDEKYPYIFAKFKIDSKVEKENKSMRKRESKSPPLFNARHVNSLRSTLSRIETNDAKAEAELKGILNDMGLIDDGSVEKRAAELIEDEDLEHGTNKINLVKAEETESKSKTVSHTSPTKSSKAVTKQYAMIEIPEPKHINEDEIIEEYMIKHPDQFQQQENREKRSGDVAAQVERQIKERLQKIKEEVRNEIEALRNGEDAEEEDDREEDEQEEEGEEESKSQRRKRDAISSLVEEETSDLDPVLFGDNNLVPHIRRRRSIDESATKKSVNDDGHLIVDLNPDYSDNRKIKGAVPNLDTTTHQYHAATAQRFLSRSLKELSMRDDDAVIYENPDFDLENSVVMREKKACKCEGQDCSKCSKQKPLVGTDGSDFVYFEGAPYRKEPVVKRNHRELNNGEYRLDLNPDVYRITEQRTKRDNFQDLLAIHGQDLVAVRERSMRAKRSAREEPVRQRTLTDMTDEELWGVIPQSFEGELARHKRVKRAR